jgi:hypothetical protein
MNLLTIDAIFSAGDQQRVLEKPGAPPRGAERGRFQDVPPRLAHSRRGAVRCKWQAQEAKREGRLTNDIV